MKPCSRRPRAVRRGFTLIELLTVIAIIAILAGLLFPVFNAVRENARKTACMTNMHQIVQAMKMYKDDWRVYPDALYGVAYKTGSGSTPFALRLAGGYVKDPSVFTCPNHVQQLKGQDAAKNPAFVVNPWDQVANGPYIDYKGRQVYFSLSDTYDWQVRPNTQAALGNIKQTEPHYTLKWTKTAAGLSDDPRQLLYKEPPDNTVVTWCMYHSGMNPSGIPQKGGIALVAFLSGRVQSIPADALQSWPNASGQMPWQVPPKP